MSATSDRREIECFADYVRRLEMLRDYIEVSGEFLPGGQFTIAIDSTKLATLLKMARPDEPSTQEPG